eukprot:CAMPEP_0206464914 /NCGR_PEP_ID=MMETSP0324_2-20121206/27502_1 /ASSEMBLY_ACC=CAM_ASM_000836 /TAXON_ID=2866 /ORGANISM="Crypthecodinium cohnii, Strain Seligo" /LENGTH=371 /DNA_ID=CAMNT_0053937641 /DNA_START=49 /DNA_END=1165 /DNA_ORIENTATION=+
MSDAAWERTKTLRSSRACRSKSLSFLLPSHPRIEDAGLHAVDTHKYTPGPITPLDRFLYVYWWEPVAKRLPLWLAPNAITLIGATAALMSGILLWICSPNLEGGAPVWAEFGAGMLVLIYQTCDAVDGLQARRTGATSPLGELLDHGCDGTCLTSFTLGYCVSQQCGLGLLTATSLVVSWFPWWLAQWEAYHTGVVRTGGETFGITEIEFMVAAIHFITAICGADVWKIQIFQLSNGTVVDLRTAAVIIQLVVATVLAGLSVKYALVTRSSSKEVAVALSRTWPLVTLAAITVSWPLLFPTALRAPGLLASCSMFTRIASEMVLVHMTKESYPKSQVGVLSLLFVFVVGCLGLQMVLAACACPGPLRSTVF